MPGGISQAPRTAGATDISAQRRSVTFWIDGAMADTPTDALKRTPLYDLHVARGAKLVPFAGYQMPVQYPMGVMDEHKWTRTHAGIFDVSHMGPCFLSLEEGIGGGDEQLRVLARLLGRSPAQGIAQTAKPSGEPIADNLLLPPPLA